MRKRNLISAAILIALGIGYAILAVQLPTRNIENATGPSFFPLVVVTGFLILSASLLVQAMLPAELGKVPALVKISPAKFGWAFAAAVIYLAALPWLGFIAANIPLFAVLMILYGEKRPAWVIGGSLMISIAVFFVFREVFQIHLPAGILGGVI